MCDEKTDRMIPVQDDNGLNEPEIRLSLAEAKDAYSLFKNVEAADDCFKSCQAQPFRLHVQATYKSGKVQRVFEKLKNFIESEEK